MIEKEEVAVRNCMFGGCLSLLILLGGCAILMDRGCGKGGDDAPTSSTSVPDEFAARTMAKYFVKNRLKAPSTAKFPWDLDDYNIVDLGEGRWIVSSYVDAENSFGAHLRTRYVLVLQWMGEDRWRLESLDLLE